MLLRYWRRADAETVKLALRKVLENKNVKGIFINILGGITRCDEVAKGIVEVLKEHPNVKFAVRMMGTNEEIGRKYWKNMEYLMRHQWKKQEEN